MRAYKRGSVWWIDYFYGSERIRESAKTTSKKKALQLLAKRQAAIFEGRFDLQEVKQSPRFCDYADEYLETYSKVNKKPQSHRRDQVSIKHLNEFFGKRRLNEIRPMLIEHYKRKRKEAGKTPATINRELACMKHVYTIAIRNKKALANPVKEVKLLREDNQVTRVLSEEDEEKLLESSSAHIRGVIICALETGMRLGEILDLRWEHVDLREGIILVEKTKTWQSREIPISPRLREVLLSQGRRGERDSVFSWRDGKSIGSVKTGYKAALRRAGLEGKQYRFHDLRHTFATRLVMNGEDIITVRDLLGHSSVVTTQRYAHSGREDKRKAIARLSRGGYRSGVQEAGGKLRGTIGGTIRNRRRAAKTV
jgi:integrase